MKFIKPKNTNAQRVKWEVSEQTRAIVKYYAEFTEYDESEIVDTFLKNILDDKDFIEWISKKRNNKRLVKKMEAEELVEEDKIG